MPAKYPLTHLFLTLLGGLVCAAAAAFLLNFLLSGPKLWKHYDFLMSRKPPPPVSREILIIETDDFIESSDIFLVLMTLTEMDASNLILTGRVSPSSSVSVTEADIRRRFIDEYILLGTNIRNLFEAIRSGSVSPVHAPGYVERLVELTEQGRDRLLASLIERDEDLLRSIAIFGNYLEIETKPEFDRDGVIRRVQPVDQQSSLEHPVFMSLKHRYADSKIETADDRQALWLRGYDGNDFDLPMDINGNILVPFNCTFRHVDISLFREYDEADRAMRAALTAADELGAFSQTLPERSPLFLGDYAFILRDELLRAPDGEKRSAWTRARSNYFKSLEEFLEGPAELLLVKGYNDVIEDETSLSEEGLASLAAMRDEMTDSFAVMRGQHGKLSAVYEKLQDELVLSFCIMGPQDMTQYSALLANTLITGAHIIPGNDRYVLFWSIAASLFILLIVFMLRPSFVLLAGISLSAAMAAGFGFLFVLTSYWIDPAIVLCSSAAGVLFIFYCKLAIIKHRARRFRHAYGMAIPADILKELIRTGRPRLNEVVIAAAAVVAVKDINLLKSEDSEKPQSAGIYKKEFFTAVKQAAFNAGAAVAGFEGDTVLVCFGSPLDKTAKPVHRACAFAKELLDNNEISWHFGIDCGECTFLWSPDTGYSVNGRPAVRARILASRTIKQNVRILVSDNIRSRKEN